MGAPLRTDHHPFPMPSTPYALTQEWRHLTFMHWEVDPQRLDPYIPEGLNLDLFEGKAYVGTIPFEMKKVRPRWLPWLPGVSNFPEFNVRLYVVKDDKPGVLFLTLDTSSRITSAYAPRAYGLPYRLARCRFSVKDDRYAWFSRRRSDGATLRGYANGIGEETQATPGSLEAFLFERYSLYTVHKGSLCIGHTHHNPWRFKLAEVTLESNSLTDVYDVGIEDVLRPDMVHVSEGVRVNTWPLQLAERLAPGDDRDVLFLDGDCGLCHRLANFIDKRLARGQQLAYRPILSEDAQRIIATFPINMRSADSVYLIRNGKPYMRSAAGIRALLYMKWRWKMWYPVVWLVPLPLRNLVYRFIAKYRHRIFKPPTECMFRVD